MFLMTGILMFSVRVSLWISAVERVFLIITRARCLNRLSAALCMKVLLKWWP